MPLEIPSGSVTLMKMNTPPTGWVKTNTGNLHALRVVNGSVTSGGSVNYTSVFTNLTSTVSSSSVSIGGISLALNQIPTHQHAYFTAGTSTAQSTVSPPSSSASLIASPTPTFISSGGSPTAGSATHTHPITAPVTGISGWLDMQVKYVDSILVQRS